MIDTVHSTLMAASTARTFLEWARLRRLDQWWHWLLLVAVCLAILTYVVRLYRRDAVELSRGVRWALLALRITAMAGLLIFFLNLQKRTESEIVRTSRVAVLVDTSQSMGLTDASPAGRESRLGQVIEALSQGRLLTDLLAKHDVVVYRFDQTAAPSQIAAFAKTSSPTTSSAVNSNSGDELIRARVIYLTAAIMIAIGLICWGLQWWLGLRARGSEGEAYLLLVGMLLLIMAAIVAGVTNLRYSQFTLAQVMGQGAAPISVKETAAAETPEPSPASSTATTPEDIDWTAELTPRGVETRLGDALRWTIDRERDGPLAGIVVVTDGCHNAGITPESVIQAAQAADIRIFPVGMGSEKQPRSIRLVDLEIPPRVYPGDRYTITGYVQADGLEGRTIRLSLDERTPDDEPTEQHLERRVTLGADGEITPVQFEITPDKVGQFKWVMQVDAPERDDLDPGDNTKQGRVEVVERKSRVLLLAGGPTRDYRFLRNLLFRDRTTEVDVLLQSAPPGAAQEADRVLLEFPDDRDTLFAYDCVVAFDPDWAQLSLEQIRLLDEWVADKAGGMIVVAGPVYTPGWTRGRRSGNDEEKLQIVKDLYPVSFYGRGAATIQLGRVGADVPWPLQFSDEGRRARFLWLDDSPTASEEAWKSFAGVYGYQALRGVKPGAQVYARFSDPQAATLDELPVYMAGQYYGAGRVFYVGSGELWRLNAMDPGYFENLYTKLIRQVSQGRLLRDSSRGVLLVDNERCSLGDTVTVRAALSDEQYRPLTLAAVEANVIHEDGERQSLQLRRLAAAERPGMYSGQFTATRAGDLRIDLGIPGVENEILSRQVKVRLPVLEVEHPQRNDALLANLAKQTDASYAVGLAVAMGERGGASLANQITAKDQVTYLPGTPDRRFERRLMTWLMTLICGALSLEWLLRRLYKLA